MDARSVLRDGADALEVQLDELQIGKFFEFLALLNKWNQVYNLTAIRDTEKMLVLHVLDSLAIVPTIDRLNVKSVLDVGSGAGFPGIPLAIARPRLNVDLVDTVQKKAAFLSQVKAELKLDKVRVHHSRVESLALAEQPDCIVSRAFSDLPALIEKAGGLLAAGGRFVAMKGVIPHGEIARLPEKWRASEVADIQVPGLDARRSLVIITANVR